MVLDFHEINIKKNQFQQILQLQFHWRLPIQLKTVITDTLKSGVLSTLKW